MEAAMQCLINLLFGLLGFRSGLEFARLLHRLKQSVDEYSITILNESENKAHKKGIFV